YVAFGRRDQERREHRRADIVEIVHHAVRRERIVPTRRLRFRRVRYEGQSGQCKLRLLHDGMTSCAHGETSDEALRNTSAASSRRLPRWASSWATAIVSPGTQRMENCFAHSVPHTLRKSLQTSR